MITFITKKVAHPLIIITLIFSALFSWLIFTHADKNATETTYYFLNDHLGNVDVVLDGEGNVVERADYLPYGNDRLRIDNSPSENDDHKFTGKEKDDETGLYYYGARYYDPTIGRFESFDPLLLDEGTKPMNSILQNPQALNPYTYALNNPVRYTDETGEYQKDVHYDLTLYLGLIAGLQFEQAETIAFRDQYMDENPETLPASIWHPIATLSNLNSGATEYYHFASRKDALGRLQSALDAKNLEAFGDALHTFQDTYSHQGLTPKSHAELGTAPDLTINNVPKAMNMARTSYFQLRKENLEVNGPGKLTKDQYIKQTTKLWNVFKPEIENYLKLEDKKNTNIYEVARIAEKKSDR